MTAESLTNELKTAEQSLVRCSCGAKPKIRYEPGITYVGCWCDTAKKHAAVPDWDPKKCARKWNGQGETRP